MKVFSIKNLLILIPFLLLLNACKDKDKQLIIEPIILDEANLLSNETKEDVMNAEYPKGVPIVVISSEKEDSAYVGIKANEAFDKMSKEHSYPKAFKKRGVLIYMTNDPELIQVRTGDKYNYFLNYKGFTAGQNYLTLQKNIGTAGFNESLKSFINNTIEGISLLEDLHWYQRYRIDFSIKSISSLLGGYSYPVNNFWGNFYYKPTLKMTLWLQSFLNSWILSFLFFGIIIYIIKSIVLNIGRKIIPSRRTYISLFFNIAVNICFSLLYCISTALSAVLLSGSRLEDRLSIKIIDSKFIEGLSFSEDLFNASTSNIVIVLFLSVFILKIILSNPLALIYSGESESKQRERYNALKNQSKMYAAKIELMGINDSNFDKSPFWSALSKNLENQGGKLGLFIAATTIIPQIYLLCYILFAIPDLVVSILNVYRQWRFEKKFFSLGRLKLDISTGLFVVFIILILIFLFIIRITDPFR